MNKSVAHEALLSAEQTARQELTEVLEKQRVEAHREKEKLLLEVCSNVNFVTEIQSVKTAAILFQNPPASPFQLTLMLDVGGFLMDHLFVFSDQ